MGRAVRISLSLTEQEHTKLRRLAGREQKPAAVVGALLLAGGLERELQHAVLESEEGTLAVWPEELHTLAREVVDALAEPGVPAILAGHRHAASDAALRAAAFLELASCWLGDGRPRLARGAPPRMADARAARSDRYDVGAALALAGGADGATIRQNSGVSSPATSDKQTLSDIDQHGGEE